MDKDVVDKVDVATRKGSRSIIHATTVQQSARRRPFGFIILLSSNEMLRFEENGILYGKDMRGLAQKRD